jgi:chromosomal replication initiation ATPase DnaA
MSDLPKMAVFAAEHAARAGMTVAELKARTRCHEISKPRQKVMAAMIAAGYTQANVARFWNVHHSTVIHACRVSQ